MKASTVLEAGQTQVIVDLPGRNALRRDRELLRHDIGRLPVVERALRARSSAISAAPPFLERASIITARKTCAKAAPASVAPGVLWVFPIEVQLGGLVDLNPLRDSFFAR